MTFIFILSLALFVAGLAVVIHGLLRRVATKDRVRFNPNFYGQKNTPETIPDPSSLRNALFGAAAVVVSLALFTLTIVTTVPAQNVGVVTSFGKPVGQPLDSGLHFKAPWHKVTDMDGTIQQENNYWDAPDPSDNSKLVDGRTKIRLNSTNGEMFVNNQLRWRIKRDAAGSLFADWKKFDKIGPGLVQKQLAAALNDVLGGYDPLTVGAKNISNDQVGLQTAAKLQERLGGDVEIIGLTVTTIDFDDATQARINDFQTEVARTRIAEQRKLTVDAEVYSNNKLATSVKDPNVLVSKCLDTQKTMVDKGQSLLGIPGCFPGQNGPVQTLPVK